MTTIRLYRKCEELFGNAKIAEVIFRFLCDGIEECEDAEPERKKGKWVDETFEFEPWWVVHHPYKCNQCGERSEEDSNFCPNCGADMRGEADGHN